MIGVIRENGNSEITFAQKYGPGLYMLLLTSLRNTGLSSGKIRITFWMALNEIFMQMKNKDPLMFYIPSGVWSVLKKSKMAKMAVMTVVIIFTYEVWGSLRRLRKFLLARSPN